MKTEGDGKMILSSGKVYRRVYPGVFIEIFKHPATAKRVKDGSTITMRILNTTGNPTSMQTRFTLEDFTVYKGDIAPSGFEKDVHDILTAEQEREYSLIKKDGKYIIVGSKVAIRIDPESGRVEHRNAPPTSMGFMFIPPVHAKDYIVSSFDSQSLPAFAEQFYRETIVTADGEEKIDLPILPIRLPTSEGVPYPFSTGGPFTRIAVRGRVKTVPGFIVKTRAGEVYYKNPLRWFVLKGDRIIEKIYGDVIKGEVNSNVLKGTRRTYYYQMELKTGQRPLYTAIEGDTAYLFGVVTPEGVFSLKTDRTRIEKRGPISIFEENVEIIGAHMVFPASVPIKNSSIDITVKNDYEYLLVPVINSVRLLPLPNYFVHMTPKAYFLELGIGPDDYPAVANYGLEQFL